MENERIASPALAQGIQDATGEPTAEEHGGEHAFSRVEAARIVLVALAAAAVWLHLREPFGRVSLSVWPAFLSADGRYSAKRLKTSPRGG
jgi:hypothetical protein